MTMRHVPTERELFELAVMRGDACRAILGDRAEDAISLLAVASFQLQAAHVGARMAVMANDGAHTRTLTTIATDYCGAFSAALNLSVRCSSTVVDLCAAALGRLSGHTTSLARENDAAEVRKILATSPPEPRLEPLVIPFLARLTSSDWASIEELRHQVTHRRYRRGVYATALRPPDPAPLAFPQQLDVEWGAKMVPMDETSRKIVDFADATFREFCENLAKLVRR